MKKNSSRAASKKPAAKSRVIKRRGDKMTPEETVVKDEAAKAAPEASALPKWFADDLVTPFKAGIASLFIVHGNINDLVRKPDPTDDPGKNFIPLRHFWERVFDEREIVIFYNIASGIRFLAPEMEEKFKKAAGIKEEEDLSKDPIAAAKAGLAQKRGLPKEPEACLPLIEKALRNSDGVAVVINSIHSIAPASTGGGAVSLNPIERVNVERLKNMASDEEIRAKGNIVLLLTDSAAKVSTELRQGAELQTVFVPKPPKDYRKEFITSLAQNDDYKALLPADFDADVFALATQGMSLRQIMEIFLQARKTGETIGLDFVKRKKREILNNEYGELFEVVEPERGLEDIGGLEYIKDHCRLFLEAIKKGEFRLVPMGELWMGPPGTGKTALVEALAKEAGFNFVKMKNAKSMWVGESEARKEKQIYGLRSLAPVVVMNDEADLAEAQRDSPKGDSGVSDYLMKMWMELLSDPRIRGQIIIISCTNRPDRMDPALKRSGRSDERILIPMPSEVERKAIFGVMFKRYKIPTVINDFYSFAEMTDGLSGADIEKIVLNSYRFAFEQSKEKVDSDALREAIEDFIPSASQADIDYMTLLGILESSSRRLLPPNINEMVAKIEARNLLENTKEMVDQIRARGILRENSSKNGSADGLSRT